MTSRLNLENWPQLFAGAVELVPSAFDSGLAAFNDVLVARRALRARS